MDKSQKCYPAVKLVQRSGLDRRKEKINFDGPDRRKNIDRRVVWSVINEWSLAISAGPNMLNS